MDGRTKVTKVAGSVEVFYNFYGYREWVVYDGSNDRMTEKKKILLVSDGFFPEISPRSFRATELAKEFYRQGHEVVVISKYRDYNYSEFINEFQITFKMWSKPRYPRIPDFRLKLLHVAGKKLARVLSILFEYPSIEEMFQTKKMLRNEEGYDLMISFAVPYPVHWGVALARSPVHPIAGTWIADCGDPYMGDVLDSFRKPFYFGILEKKFCIKADFVSIPVESARSGYYPEFHHKIKIIPQGFDFDMTGRKKKNNVNTIPEFAYAGGFLLGIRDPGLLMRCLIKIDIPFKFYIFTNQQELLTEYQDALNAKLIVSGYIPRNELINKLSRLDFLINFDNNTSLNVPSKLIDYAITNLPVLNIDKNFSFDDIMAFLKGDYRNRMTLPDPEQYHISNVTKLFLNLLPS